jgi:hypothetical protein
MERGILALATPALADWDKASTVEARRLVNAFALKSLRSYSWGTAGVNRLISERIKGLVAQWR